MRVGCAALCECVLKAGGRALFEIPVDPLYHHDVGICGLQDLEHSDNVPCLSPLQIAQQQAGALTAQFRSPERDTQISGERRDRKPAQKCCQTG